MLLCSCAHRRAPARAAGHRRPSRQRQRPDAAAERADHAAAAGADREQGERALPGGGPRGRTARHHHQAHPAEHPHVHSHAVARLAANFRHPGPARQCGAGQGRDRELHSVAHYERRHSARDG